MAKNLLTGTAQPVTNTTERVRDLFQNRVEWQPRPAAERKSFRKPQKFDRRPDEKLLDTADEDQGAAPQGEAAESDATAEDTASDER